MKKKYKNKYRIESNRHPYWDYSLPGGYFITICTANRACFLGEIINEVMHLSPYGQVVHDEFLRIPDYHRQVELGAWVVMPDHVHMIINIVDDSVNRGNGDVDVIDNVNVGENTAIEKIHEFSLSAPSPSSAPSLSSAPSAPSAPSPSSAPSPPSASSPSSPSNRQWWRNPDYTPTIDEIKQYRKQRRKMIIPKIVGKFKMLTSKQINGIRQSAAQKNWQANYHDSIIRDVASYERISAYIKNNPSKWKKGKSNGNGR